MKNILLILFILLSFNSFGQCTDCNSFENALKNPKEVKSIKINPWQHGITLDKVPVSIKKFVNAEIIYLAGHNFTTIPKEIGNLKKLKELSFAQCKLTQLPEQIFELKNLKELILLNNQFSKEYIIKIKEKFKTKMPNTKVLISGIE